MSYAKKIFSVIFSVILVFSFSVSLAGASVYAAEDGNKKLPATTEKKNQFAKAYVMKVKGKTSYGYDWSYNLYSKSIKVSCKYDFKKHEYKFKVTGSKYGLQKLELKYKSSDKKWVNVPMKVFVDPDKNIMRTKLKFN